MSRAATSVPDAAELAARFGADGAILYAIEGQELGIVDIWPVHPSAAGLKLQVGFGVTGRVARSTVCSSWGPKRSTRTAEPVVRELRSTAATRATCRPTKYSARRSCPWLHRS